MTDKTVLRLDIDRPECPRSTSFTVAFCSNPACGAHTIGYDEDGEAVLEIALSRDPHGDN